MPNSLLFNTAATNIQKSSFDFGGCTCTLPFPCENDTLKHRLFCLFISIKNRNFTRDYIQWFVKACDENGFQGLICAVDEPYIFNRMAEMEVDNLPAHESAKIYQLSKEVTRKAEKVIRGCMSENVVLASWAALSATTPVWMKEEVMMAYKLQGAFWSYIRGHVAELKNINNDASLDRFAQFFLCELPVLIHSYYHQLDGVVDIYPGPNADVFNMVEQGVFKEELPRMTSFARAGCPLVYLDTGKQRQT